MCDKALAFCGKHDHRSYAELLNCKAGKQNGGHIGVQEKAQDTSLKRDILCNRHKPYLGLSKMVNSQNGFNRSGSVLCYKKSHPYNDDLSPSQLMRQIMLV